MSVSVGVFFLVTEGVEWDGGGWMEVGDTVGGERIGKGVLGLGRGIVTRTGTGTRIGVRIGIGRAMGSGSGIGRGTAIGSGSGIASWLPSEAAF